MVKAKTSPPQDEVSEFSVKDYLQVSFELVNAKLASIDDKATKTDASLQGVIRTMNQMQLLDAGHFASCPNTISLSTLDKKIDAEIKVLETRISEFEFLKRYWKVFATFGAIVIVGMIVTGYFTFEKINEILNQNKQTPIQNEIPATKFPQSNSLTFGKSSIHPTM